MLIAILTHIVATALICGGAWLVFAAAVAAAFPESLDLDHALAGYSAGPEIARHTREIAILFVVIGLLMFVAGVTIGARVIA